MTPAMTLAPEFSRPLPIDRIGSLARIHALDATAQECTAVARRLGILAVDSLSARLTVQAVGASYRVSGAVTGTVQVACAVTLAPVTQAIDTRFECLFTVDEEGEAAEEIALSAEDCDTEPLTGGLIDLGECAVQALALAIDYTPRAPGAEEVAKAVGLLDEEAAARLSNPFSVLKPLSER